MKKLLAFASIVLSPVFGVEFPYNCTSSSIAAVANFNLTNYLGLWYEVQRYENPFETGQCVTAEYTTKDNTSITITNTQIVNDTVQTVNATAYLETPSNADGKLVISYSPGQESPYWVIGTDYTNYAVVWSCADNDINNSSSSSSQNVWVLSRNYTLSSSASSTVEQIIHSNNLNTSSLHATEQDEKICGRGQGSNNRFSVSLSIILILLTFLSNK